MDAMPDAAVPRLAWRCYWLEGKYELFRLLRTPSFVLPSLLFPPLFYVLFGVLLGGGRDGGEAARYLLATYGVFGIMGAGLFAFGVTVALEREQGFMALKQAQPMPPGAYLLAKMAMAMAFATVISATLAVLAATLGGVRLLPSQWLLLQLVNVLGVLPFCALGLFVGSVVGGQGAPAVVNLLYLPMAFLSGLWLPLTLLPKLIATLAPAWPSYHLAQLALKVVGRDAGGTVAGHLGVLLLVTACFFLLARRRLARAA